MPLRKNLKFFMVNNMKILQTISLPELTNWSVRYLLDFSFNYNEDFDLMPIGQFLTRNRNLVNIQDDETYQRVTVRAKNKGVCLRDTEIGKKIGTKKQYTVSSGQFIISKIDARNGAMGLIPDDLDGAIVTNDFPTFIVDNNRINSQFLLLLTTAKTFINFAQSCSSGTTNRQRINIEQFLNIKIPLPSIGEQNKIIVNYNTKTQLAKKQKTKAKQLELDINNYLFEVLGIERLKKRQKQLLQIINYSKLDRWDNSKAFTLKSKYPVKRVSEILIDISTGTTPPTTRKEYFDNGTINFYTPADLTDKMYLEKSERKVTQLAIDERKARKFKKNTLLFVGIGSTVGKVGIIKNGFATSNQQITGLSLDFTIVDIEFVYFYFNNFINITTKEKTQATIPIVNQNKILNIPIPIPPIEIQEEIATQITDLKQQIQDLKNQAEQNQAKAIKEFEQEIFITD
ncbi:MAG: hypothetical protein COB73_03730 [Flavobacteriaceae bacterium]|nr:MAG: hypothetical protein COB73_03730 [Flavobacteriaceae bacterium]